MMAEERKLVHAELQDVLAQKQTAFEKCTALRQENLGLKNDIQDLKTSVRLQVNETIHNAKHSSILSILQAKIQMAEEAGDKGLDIWGKQVESWKQALEKMEDKEAAVILEKVSEKDDNGGTSTGVVEKKKDEGAEAPEVGDEGHMPRPEPVVHLLF